MKWLPAIAYACCFGTAVLLVLSDVAPLVGVLLAFMTGANVGLDVGLGRRRRA